MNDLILAVILLLLSLAGLVARKTYYALPAGELKRRAARHDPAAAQLYRAVAHGGSLRLLLWLYSGLTGAAGLALLARALPVWAGLLLIALLLWLAFSWLPATRSTALGLRLTRLVTPLIVWLLNYLHPSFSRAAELVERRYSAAAGTGLFERDDLLALLERQPRQPDNRLTDEELTIVQRALTFDDHEVGTAMTPRQRVKIVQAGDTVGPILIDEVHKSGQDYALVREGRGSKSPFAGTLALARLGLKSAGTVRDLMDDAVYYLHEHDSLGQALHAFFVTNCPVFIVINSTGEYVGVLTVTGVLKQLLGHVPGDDFEQYSDPAAVAARHSAAAELAGQADSAAAEKAADDAGKTDKAVVE